MAQSDILVSGAWLWYAPEDEPLPDETTIDIGDDWAGNWEWLGLTTEPLTLNLSAEEFELDVQQLSTPILSSITSEVVTLTTTLAEQTAENLALIFGGNITTTAAGAAQRGYTELAFGGRTVRTIYSVGFEVIHTTAAGLRFPLRLFFHRAQISLAGDISYNKAGVAGLPITITVLSDDAQAADEKLGIWQKVTAEITA